MGGEGRSRGGDNVSQSLEVVLMGTIFPLIGNAGHGRSECQPGR